MTKYSLSSIVKNVNETSNHYSKKKKNHNHKQTYHDDLDTSNILIFKILVKRHMLQSIHEINFSI